MLDKISGKHGKGFTLIEVVIASVILAVILTAVGFFFSNMIKQSDIVDNRTRDLQDSRQGLEKIRTLDVASMPDGRVGPETLESFFDRYVEVSTPYTEYLDAKLVRCVVVWDTQDGPDSISLSSIF